MKFIEEWVGSSVGADLLTIALFSALAVGSYVGIRLALPAAGTAARRSASAWDDIILDGRVRHRVSLLGPAAVFYLGVRLAGDASSGWHDFLLRVSAAVAVLLLALLASSVLRAANLLYERRAVSRDRPIEPFIQVVGIVLYLIAGVTIVAILADQPPWFFIGGIGAMTAVLLLVFKDTILSFVASIQLVQDDLVDIGDWIEVPQFGANGRVVDVKLHTVTVENFDKTISTIPSYGLISGAFLNWRGMERAGRRRIKRAIPIDVATIRFLTEDEIDRLARFEPLRDYMAAKRAELADDRRVRSDDSLYRDHRRLTNIGTLRAYVLEYLKRIDTVDTDGMSFLVRQLDPGPEGVPLEVMVFANETSLAAYEAIQSDIFDHVLAMVPQFGLRVYQQASSGTDILAPSDRLPVLEDAGDLRVVDLS